MTSKFTGGVMTREKCIRILGKILEYALYGLAFFIPISIALTEIFTATAIVSFILRKILSVKYGNQNGPNFNSVKLKSIGTPANIFLLLFFVFCGLSLVNCGPYLAKGLNALFGKWGKFILLFWVTAYTLDGRKLRNITLVFLASGALVVLDAFSQKFFGTEFLLHRTMIDVNYADRIVFAVTGAFKHPNNLASYLICLIPLLAVVASLNKKYFFPNLRGIPASGLRITFFTVGVLSLIGLVLTFSRAGWLSFIMALVVMLFLRPKKKWLWVLCAIFILLISFSPGVSERAVTAFRGGGDSGRYELWKGAFDMIREHPFLGKGIGTFMAFFQDYVQGRGAMYAHNCYIQIWAETGIFALLFFLIFVGTVLWGGLKMIRQTPCEETRAILTGLCAGAIAFLIQSALDTNLYSLQPSAMFWLFMGMIQAVSVNLVYRTHGPAFH
jgi:O-antigen ligase